MEHNINSEKVTKLIKKFRKDCIKVKPTNLELISFVAVIQQITYEETGIFAVSDELVKAISDRCSDEDGAEVVIFNATVE